MGVWTVMGCWGTFRLKGQEGARGVEVKVLWDVAFCRWLGFPAPPPSLLSGNVALVGLLGCL